MIKFLGGYIDPRHDDKPKVKEADTIKIPAFHWQKPIAIGELRPEKQL